MSNLVKKNLIKEADINVKTDFLSDALEGRIIDEALKALPFLKDVNYKVEIKNKDDEGGSLRGFIQAFLPEKKNPNSNIRLVIPILCLNYKMKPIDTIIINNSAFPATDSTVKELLLNPETFRRLTMKELKESRILAKIAEENYEDLIEKLNIAKTNAENQPKLASCIDTYINTVTHYKSLLKQAENFSEPILNCILRRTKNFDFEAYYVKIASDVSGLNKHFSFQKDTIDAKGARLLLESMGYNSEKLADELNSKKEVFLKSPITNSYNPSSFAYDHSQVKSTKMFSSIPNGPAKVMDAKGRELKGVVYDLYSMASQSANNMPKGKVFLDYSKNYFIGGDIQGVPNEDETILSEDNIETNTTGIFIDPEKNIAFGPIKITSMFSMPGEEVSITANMEGKKVKIKKVDMLKTYISDGNELMIPKYFQWVAFNKKINLLEANANDLINTKISADSYTITKQADDRISLTKFADRNFPPYFIPSMQHLNLFFEKIGMDGKDGNIEKIEKGQPVTFFTTFPLTEMLYPSKYTPANAPFVSEKLAEEVTEVIKKHVEPLMVILPKLADVFTVKKYADDLDDLTKEGGTTDSLDSIFSLGIVNDVNSVIFLQNIDKLKFTLSYLAALRLYIRTGWDVGIKESDVSTAIDALSEIVSGLELIKAQKMLDKQLAMQNS